MSRDNLGNKQTIILHNGIINDERYNLVITPHKQTTGYIRTKRQTFRKKTISKQDKLFENRFQSEETQCPNQKSVKNKNFVS